jgi:hypothetical protein
MRRSRGARTGVLFILLVFLAVGIPVKAAGLTDYERDVLTVCEGVVRYFDEDPDRAWPGYSLAVRPFVVYIPGRWAILLNAGRAVEGFGPCPADWPDLGADVLYHEGSYGDLVGQLAFELDIDGIRTVAVGFPETLPESLENAELKMFGYIVHEAFHQYQYEFFGETPWAREQEYPIEDRENAALAYLEMLALIDALEGVRDDDAGACRESIARFLALRDYRWARADSFVSVYEQGQEVHEGTARYVELTSFDLMRGVEYASAVTGTWSPLAEHFEEASMPGYLIARFGDRMADGYLPIEDLFRNRIYPVGSAQCVLLDYLGVDWKAEAQNETPEFTYAALLRESVGVGEEDYPGFLADAKERYGYDAVLAASEEEIGRYLAGFQQAVDAFESQPGRRVEVALSSNGVYRSRVSSADKWVVDRGTRSICSNYQVYTLKTDDLFLEVHDTGVLEEDDFRAYRKRVAFYSPEITSIRVDGEPLATEGDAVRPFGTIEMAGGGFALRSSRPGTIRLSGGRVVVDLIPAPE